MAKVWSILKLALLVISGYSLADASIIGDHSVTYGGDSKVREGDSFRIHCWLPIGDTALWTLNSSTPIRGENSLGYLLGEGEEGSLRRQLLLESSSAQLYHEGEYRCSRFSRDSHYLRVKAAFSSDDQEDDDDEEVESTKPSYEQEMKINETYEFECDAGLDEEVITWYKNGGLFRDSNVDISGRNLIIHSAQEDDAGEYMCIVMPQFSSDFLDGEGRLFRLTSPTKILDLPAVENLVRGQSLELSCRTQGFPEPKITWLIGNLNASDVSVRDKRVSVHVLTRSSSTLIIRNLTETDRGLYTCHAEGDEKSVFVHVRENMIQTNEDYPGMGKVLKPGEELVLICNTTVCPHCTVVWFKDGEQLRGVSDRLKIYGNNTLAIEQANYNDSGIYTCKINRTVLDVDLQATIVVQSKISLKRFDISSVVVQGSPLELLCQAEGGPTPLIKWYIGGEEIEGDDDARIKLLDHAGMKNAKLVIEEADYSDRNHYMCEAYNQIDSVNTTIFVRIKGKLAALWPFLGICAEVAILCSIIFVYERRKSMSQVDEPDTDMPTENKHHHDQKLKGQDIRQRK